MHEQLIDVDLESVRDFIQSFDIDHNIPFFILGQGRFALADGCRQLFQGHIFPRSEITDLLSCLNTP